MHLFSPTLTPTTRNPSSRKKKISCYQSSDYTLHVMQSLSHVFLSMQELNVNSSLHHFLWLYIFNFLFLGILEMMSVVTGAGGKAKLPRWSKEFRTFFYVLEKGSNFDSPFWLLPNFH
jgi:xanthine/uracil/vitamin C permease (AzgA family)